MAPRNEPPLGILLSEGVQGESVTVGTRGSDVLDWLGGAAQDAVALAVADAKRAGVVFPSGVQVRLAAVQVFYRHGEPAEARAVGLIHEGDGTSRGWATSPAPRWGADGGMIPEDAERAHFALRVGALPTKQPEAHKRDVILRWWNFQEHGNRALRPWRDLRGIVLSSSDLPEELQALVMAELQRAADKGSKEAQRVMDPQGAEWRAKVARRLRGHLAALRDAVGMSGEDPPSDDEGDELNRRTAAWITETFRERAGDAAEELLHRAKGSNPWNPWWPEPEGDRPPWLWRLVANLTWEAVADDVRQERTPATTLLVHNKQISALQEVARNPNLPGFEAAEIRGRRGDVIATISADVAEAHRNLAVARTPTFHRLLKYLILAVARQTAAGRHEPNVVRFEGGYTGLSEALGGHGKKHVEEAKRCLDLGKALVWRFPNGIEGYSFWGVMKVPAMGQRPGWIDVEVMRPLQPGFVHVLKEAGCTEQDLHRLVVELRYGPPMKGIRPADQGAGWLMHRLLLARFSERSDLLVTEGGLPMTSGDWRSLAERAEFPLSSIDRLLDVWRTGDDREPALIQNVSPGIVTLGPVHDIEAEFLLDAGKTRVARREAGRRSASKRRAWPKK